MYIEQLNEQHTIAMRIDTCLATLTQDIAEPVQAFYAELAANGVTPKDPLVFVYRDLDGDIHRPFSLEVAQPIDEDTRAHYRGKHALGTLKPMSCVQRVHQGTLADMGERTYATMFADLAKAGIATGRECREVYTVFNGIDAADNATHVQIEVSPNAG